MEALLNLKQLCGFGFRNLLNGDARPAFYHMGNILQGHIQRVAFLLQLLNTLQQPALLHLVVGSALIVVDNGGLLLKLLNLLQLVLQVFKLHNPMIFKIHPGTGFIDNINSLVGQEAIMDIAGGHFDSGFKNLVGEAYLMEVLIVLPHALENLYTFFHSGFINHDGLEPSLQRRILFDMLTVVLQSGGADDLHIPAGQSGLQNIGGVHGSAFGLSGTHNIVHLVNNQYDIMLGLGLVNNSLHTGLKLASELGAGHNACQIQKVDLLIQELGRYLAFHNAESQPLGDGRLAHAGLTQKNGVVFGSAVKNLHNPFNFLVTAYNPINASRLGLFIKVGPKVIQMLPGRLGRGLGGLISDLGIGALVLGGRTAGLGPEIGKGIIKELQHGIHHSFVLCVLLVLAAQGCGQGLDKLFHVHVSKHLIHLVVEIFQILLCHARLGNHLLQRGQALLLGTGHTKSHGFCFSIYNTGDKNNRDIFLANRAFHHIASTPSIYYTIDCPC